MVNALNALDDEMDNIELILVDSEDSVEKQLSDVDTMIAQNVKFQNGFQGQCSRNSPELFKS